MKKIFTLILLIIISNEAVAQCWSQITTGTYHTVAIQANGTLWAWGLNDKGQLGDGTTANKNVPTQIGMDTDWAIVASFGENNLAIKNNGSLWSWGNNNLGQVGDGNYGDGVITPIPTQLGNDTDWIKLAPSRAFALKSNGTLWGWGDNSDGRLGTGDIQPHYIPFQIGTDSDWINISAGANQTLALKSNQTLWGWGLNKNGSLAIGAVNNFILIPTQTGNNTADWQKIEVGGCCSSKMIKTDNSLWAMGSGSYGNLGNGGIIDSNTPINIENQIDWDKISTSNHSGGIKNDGSLWVWGNNFQGQLGDGTTVNKSIPMQIGNNIIWSSVKTGLTHTVALTSNGSLYSWGWNNNGQLGDGTLVNKNLITAIGNACTLNITEFNISTLKIFPNPTFDILILSYTSAENSIAALSVTNIIGQNIYHQEFLSVIGINEYQIDLSTYKAGLYLLTLKTATGSVTVKIIKQ